MADAVVAPTIRQRAFADRHGAKTLEQTVEKVHGWNTRKMMFTPHQIQAVWDRLHRLGWLDVSIHADGHL